MALDPRRASIIDIAKIATGICVTLIGYLAYVLIPFWRQHEGRTEGVGLEPHMKNIVDEDGEIIAKATDDHTLVGGHHRLAVAASLGQKLFWKDTGEPVRLDPFFKGSSHRHTA
jgi:hypothetical protein